MTDPAVDKEGYLLNLDEWDEQVAQTLARLDDRELEAAHWEIIHALRAFYATTEVSPAMRPLVKLVREAFGSGKGNSIYLMELFGESPAKTAAKWAGLPRPPNCL